MTPQKIQGFDAYQIRSDTVELTVVPELGAKIISLKNLKTGREWLWHPGDALTLFRNRAGDNFSRSPLVGIDECLPTIAPCSWQGRALPDHGEVWASPWKIDANEIARGILHTTICLPVSPFIFSRTIEVRGENILLRYRLENTSACDEAYMWAIHPLFRVQSGDRLELPSSTRAALGTGADVAWVDALDTTMPAGGCSKIFAKSVTEGRVAITNHRTGDRLEYTWNPAENNSLGLWLSRGGWNGHHHFAVEPTNASPDALAEAVAQNHYATISASSVRSWSVSLRLTP